LVITRQADWQAEGALVVHSLEEGLSLALAHCPEGKDLWVMGGAEIYAQAVDMAEEAVVTEIDAQYEGDAFAPKLNSAWHEVSRESHVSSTGLKYSFVTYQASR
jgi:dihydrofolate reductase